MLWRLITRNKAQNERERKDRTRKTFGKNNTTQAGLTVVWRQHNSVSSGCFFVIHILLSIHSLLSHLNVVAFCFVSLFLQAKSSLHSIKILKQKSINIFKIICFLFYLWLLFYYWLVFCSEKSMLGRFRFCGKTAKHCLDFLEIFVKRCFFS